MLLNCGVGEDSWESLGLQGDQVKWGEVTQSCLTLWDRVDCSLPGSSVHGIFQARILEWTAMPSSRGSSWPRDQTHIFCVPYISGRFFTSEPLGKFHRYTTAAKSLQSCPTLLNSIGCSLPGSSVHGIFQARYWNGVPLPSLKVSIGACIYLWAFYFVLLIYIYNFIYIFY